LVQDALASDQIDHFDASTTTIPLEPALHEQKPRTVTVLPTQ